MSKTASRFINRQSELSLVKSLKLKQDARSQILIFKSDPASGFTRFCAESTIQQSSRCFPIYVDGSDQRGWALYSATIETLFKSKPKLFRKYVFSVAKSKKGTNARWFGAALSFIPGVGDSIKEIGGFLGDQIDQVHHEGLLQELLMRVLTAFSSDGPLLFYIDNYQNLDHWSKEFMEMAINYSDANVHFVLGHVDRNGNQDGFDLSFDRLSSQKVDIKGDGFRSPNTDFVQQIFEAHGRVLSQEDAQAVAFECGGSIYKILSIASGDNLWEALPLSIVQKAVMQILAITEQPVRRSDLIAIITDLPSIYGVNPDYIVSEIQRLEGKGHVFNTKHLDGDNLIRLVSSSIAKEILETTSLPELLFIRNQIYEYYLSAWKYSLRHAKTELALLLYRLSKHIDFSMAKRHAMQVIELSFAMGASKLAVEYVSEIVNLGAPINIEEYYIDLTFKIASKDYSKALQLIRFGSQKNWNNHTYFKLSELICLERCRKHDRFFELLENINPSLNLHEKAIAAIFRINALAHMNRIREARDHFDSAILKLEKAKAFPYLLRCATTVYEPSLSQIYLKRSLEMLDDDNDQFGFATTLANMGLLSLEQNDYSTAIEQLKQARVILRVFGTQHLNLLENILGLAYLGRGDFRVANHHFAQCIALSEGKMPKLYAKINMALAFACNECFDSAIEKFESIQDEVKAYPVDRVRQRFYSNLGITLMLSGADSDKLSQATKMMRKHPDRKYPGRTLEVASLIDSVRDGKSKPPEESLLSLFFPAYLEYWYSNPLEDLPQESLPGQTLL